MCTSLALLSLIFLSLGGSLLLLPHLVLLGGWLRNITRLFPYSIADLKLDYNFRDLLLRCGHGFSPRQFERLAAVSIAIVAWERLAAIFEGCWPV